MGTRSLEFATEEEREGWRKAFKKSKLYTPYFLVGVGVNFLLYFAGLDLSRNILWGGIVGLAVPMVTMFGLSELHYRLFMK